MHDRELSRWRHSHAFGQDRKRPGERKTFIVIALTGTMMVVEVAAGIAFGSMALLADGLHMASHAVALGINAFAYVYARRHANDARYSFGTGKVNTLGGFTGAVLLAGFALLMGGESVVRLVRPVTIAFDQAVFVAVVGLLVNGLSVFVLEHRPRGRRGPRHDEDHAHAADESHHAGEGHWHDHDHGHGHAHDHNLVSAYLHVLADALTSLLAIFALLAAKYYGLRWMDPAMGIVGAVLVARWSVGLLRATSGVLLDRSAPESVCAAIRRCIEGQADNRIVDLHVWSVGPGMYSALISVVTHAPRPPDSYKHLIPAGLGIVHAAVEVHACEVQTERIIEKSSMA